MSVDDEAATAWRRMRAAQERKLEAEAVDPQARAVHRQLAEMHEKALAAGAYSLQIVGER
ncbi:MAG: hypothetical protein EOO77_37325 [Oxalobacteraceae bacterium]|nr:MAG: hypothetical protein EOO77_37325 [Oxalobacteraceae bacterium]